MFVLSDNAAAQANAAVRHLAGKAVSLAGTWAVSSAAAGEAEQSAAGEAHQRRKASINRLFKAAAKAEQSAVDGVSKRCSTQRAESVSSKPPVRLSKAL